MGELLDLLPKVEARKLRERREIEEVLYPTFGFVLQAAILQDMIKETRSPAEVADRREVEVVAEAFQEFFHLSDGQVDYLLDMCENDLCENSVVNY